MLQCPAKTNTHSKAGPEVPAMQNCWLPDAPDAGTAKSDPEATALAIQSITHSPNRSQSKKTPNIYLVKQSLKIGVGNLSWFDVTNEKS